MAGTAEAKQVDAPIIVNLGKKGRKQIKQLTKGTGKLMDELHGCIQELRTTGKISGAAVPVVVVVKQKSKKLRIFPNL